MLVGSFGSLMVSTRWSGDERGLTRSRIEVDDLEAVIDEVYGREEAASLDPIEVEVVWPSTGWLSGSSSGRLPE